jgi:hypothetical protein
MEFHELVFNFTLKNSIIPYNKLIELITCIMHTSIIRYIDGIVLKYRRRRYRCRYRHR